MPCSPSFETVSQAFLNMGAINVVFNISPMKRLPIGSPCQENLIRFKVFNFHIMMN